MQVLDIAGDFIRLRRNLNKSEKDMKNHQEKQLRKLLVYAYKHSDFYRRKFEECGIDADNIMTAPITAFPTTDKDEIMNNYMDVLTVSEKFDQSELVDFDNNNNGGKLLKGQYHVVHSSGSTGVPRYFIYNKKEWSYIMSATARSMFWGLSMREAMALVGKQARGLYVAATGASFGGASQIKSASGFCGLEIRYLSINQSLEDWKEMAGKYKPTIIVGYPSSIKMLAQLVEEHDYPVCTQRIITAGEPLTQGVRSYLGKIFRCPIIDLYTCSESLSIGMISDGEQRGYLFDDVNYIEIIDGKMYLTALYNFSQPLIRYRMTDHIEVGDYIENSEAPFRRYQIFCGRDEDVFWLKDDEGKVEYLHPMAIEDFCIEGMLDYQFVQKSRKDFEISVESEPNADRKLICIELHKRIKAVLNEHHLDFVKIEVKSVDEIPINPKTGKKRLTIPLTFNKKGTKLTSL